MLHAERVCQILSRSTTSTTAGLNAEPYFCESLPLSTILFRDVASYFRSTHDQSDGWGRLPDYASDILMLRMDLDEDARAEAAGRLAAIGGGGVDESRLSISIRAAAVIPLDGFSADTVVADSPLLGQLISLA